MGKVRKTKEEKIKTQQRHQHSAYIYSLGNIQTTSNINKSTTSGTRGVYGYVIHDLQKTFFVSLFLVTFEVLLYILLRQHILKFPFVTY